MAETLYSSREMAEMLGITQRRVNALAKRRGVGKFVGSARVFSRGDVARLKPGPTGNPNFGKRAK
jgi:hypothetical protein